MMFPKSFSLALMLSDLGFVPETIIFLLVVGFFSPKALCVCLH